MLRNQFIFLITSNKLLFKIIFIKFYKHLIKYYFYFLSNKFKLFQVK